MKARRARALAKVTRSALLLTLFGPTDSEAASPLEREAAIVVRSLSYEKTLAERVGKGSVGIGILFNPAHASSERCARDWRAAFGSLASVKVQDRPIAVATLPYAVDNAARSAKNGGVHVFVVCDDLGTELGEIARLARTHRVLTVGTLLSYVEEKLTLGIFQTEGKYRIVVNLRAAAEAQISFSSAMLKLARIVR